MNRAGWYAAIWAMVLAAGCMLDDEGLQPTSPPNDMAQDGNADGHLAEGAVPEANALDAIGQTDASTGQPDVSQEEDGGENTADGGKDTSERDAVSEDASEEEPLPDAPNDVVQDVTVKPLPCIVDVASGIDFTCAVKGDGTLWCWGTPNYTSFSAQTTKPKKVDNLPETARLVTAGELHACAATRTAGGEDHVWCWGNKGAGRLGTGNTSGGIETTPQKVQGLPKTCKVVQLRSGCNFTCALCQGGDLYCWGANGKRQQAGADTTPRYKATKINLPAKVQQMALGGFHTCVTLGPGRQLYCWGDNGSGRLGLATSGREVSTPTSVSTMDRVTDVAAGGAHTCAIRNAGGNKELFCWGANGSAQLGLGDWGEKHAPQAVQLTATPKRLSLGCQFSCLQTEADELLCWGEHSQGQLGFEPDDWRIYAFAKKGPQFGKPVQQFDVRGNHGCAIVGSSTDNELYCWGENEHGQVGIGKESTSVLPPQKVLGCK